MPGLLTNKSPNLRTWIKRRKKLNVFANIFEKNISQTKIFIQKKYLQILCLFFWLCEVFCRNKFFSFFKKKFSFQISQKSWRSIEILFTFHIFERNLLFIWLPNHKFSREECHTSQYTVTRYSLKLDILKKVWSLKTFNKAVFALNSDAITAKLQVNPT